MAEINQLELLGVTYDIRDESKVPVSEKGMPNGVATLDENAEIPFSQLQNGIRYGSTADWSRDLSFIPKKGQIIVYNDRGTMQNGDKIVVKGKIKSVGEVLGYSLDIDSIRKAKTK